MRHIGSEIFCNVATSIFSATSTTPSRLTGGYFYYGKPIYPPEKLKEFSGQTLRLIIPGKHFGEMMKSLEELDGEYGLNLICLLPIHKRRGGGNEYNINKLLGYFRRLLLKDKDIPVIISNACAAGVIYQNLNMVYGSPFFNVNTSYDDFIKICKNPKPYLDKPIEEMYMMKVFHGMHEHFVEYVPATKIFGEDGETAEIIFTHETNQDDARDRWNFLREHTNWNRIIYVLQEARGRIPFDILRQFSKLPGEKLLVYAGVGLPEEPYFEKLKGNVITTSWLTLGRRDIIIEDKFDLVGFMNREYLEPDKKSERKNHGKKF